MPLPDFPNWYRDADKCGCTCDPPEIRYRVKVVSGGWDPGDGIPSVDSVVGSVGFGDWNTERVVDIDGTYTETVLAAPDSYNVYDNTSVLDLVSTVSTNDDGVVIERLRLVVQFFIIGNGVSYTVSIRHAAWKDAADGGVYSIGDTSTIPLTGEGAEIDFYEAEISRPPTPSGGAGTSYGFVDGGPGLAPGSFVRTMQEYITRKRGYHAYRESASAPPVIYLKETATGGFAGCPVLGLAGKVYNGARDYSGDDGSDPTAAPGVDTFSAAVLATNAYSRPNDSAEEPTFFGQRVDTGTVRTITNTIDCGGTPVSDTLVLTLSEPYDTSDLVATGEAGVGDADYQGNYDGPDAMKVLDPAEICYARRQAGLVPKIDACHLLVDVGFAPTLTIAYRKRVFSVADGSVTDTSHTVDIAMVTDEPGDTPSNQAAGRSFAAAVGLAVGDVAALGTEVLIDEVVGVSSDLLRTQIRLEPA